MSVVQQDCECAGDPVLLTNLSLLLIIFQDYCLSYACCGVGADRYHICLIV